MYNKVAFSVKLQIGTQYSILTLFQRRIFSVNFGAKALEVSGPGVNNCIFGSCE